MMKVVSHKVKWKARQACFLVASSVAVQCAQMSVAHAQSAPLQARSVYHLGAAPLDKTLVDIAQGGKVALSMDPALVKGVTAAPVSGDLTPLEAIRQALAGTGLEVVTANSGALTLQKAPVKVKSSDSLSLPLISVAAERDSGGNGYVTDTSSTFARTDTPISLTPNSVSVVNAAAIQARSDQSLQDILQDVGGVTARPGPLGVPTFAVRGFAGASVLTDGMQSTVNGELTPATLTPPIAISSVEVLKGPAAILAGDSPAGGVINIVKKTPQADPFHEVQLSYGKYGDLIESFDSTGAITPDKKLMYRFVVSDERQGQNSMGYDGTHNFYLAPTIEYKDKSTDITVGYSRTVSTAPVPAYTFGKTGGGISTERIGQPLGNASDGFAIRQNEVFFKLDQKLGDHFTFVSRADYSSAAQRQAAWTPLTTLSATNGNLFMSFDTTENIYNLSLENYMRAKYDFGPVKTTTLLGWDYQQSHYNEFEWNDGGQIVSVDNIFAPPSFPSLTGGASGLSYAIRGTATNSGLFLQEQAEFGRLHVLGSIRNSEYWGTDSIEQPGYPTSTGQGSHENAWTPNIGALYQITDDIAAYANYMGGFVPGNQLTYTGTLLAPMKSTQEEVGLKGNFLDDKLAVTASAYRISYTNQYVSDPLHPGFYIASGGAVSRGFELEAIGQVAKGVNIISHYTYNDYVQPYAPTVRVNLPHHTASLWTTYNFQSEPLQGLGVGVGLYFASNQAVGSSGHYNIPSQIETDVGVFYRRKAYGLNLSVKNLFNRNLYSSSTTSSYIPMGPERTVILTGTYDF
jgi:iron complex outermembrane receptor protein